VDNILWSGVVKDAAEYKEWQEFVVKEKAKIFIAQAGEKIFLGDIKINILHPFEDLDGQKVKDVNDSSVVVKIIYGRISFLFTGDISGKIEEKIINFSENINADVLKVAHHGSKYSSSEEFVASVLPEIAVIQVGKNSYGHPAQDVLDRLEKYDINILRTDKNGDIKIFSNGKILNF
jgi:competence protein ComEC